MGFVGKGYVARVQKGWTDSKGNDHMLHLSYNPTADRDMMRTILSALKTTDSSSIEFR